MVGKWGQRRYQAARTSVFSFEEIKDAMLKFCDPVTVLGTTKPKNHLKSETCFEEIWSQWDKLHKLKHLPKAVVDSASFMKLPMVRPGETSGEFSSARVAALEAMVTNLFNQNKVILEAVDDLRKKENTPLTYAKQVASNSGSGASLQPPANQGQGGRGRGGQQQLQPPRVVRERSGSAAKRKRVESDQQSEVQDAGNGGQDWQDNQNNRRKLRSNGVKVVRGTAGVAVGQPGGAGQARQGWKAAPRDIFVYHTHHSTTEEDIRDLVSETSKVEVLEVEKRSREGAYFGSFKIRVSRDQFDVAMQPEH